MPSVRLLPIVFVVVLAMLGLRIEVVGEQISHVRRPTVQVGAQVALAQAQAPAADAAKPPASAAAADPKADGAAPADEANGGAPAFDVTKFSPQEILALQSLSERREQIEKREQDVISREAVLKAGEARIDGKVAQLQELEKAIKAELAKYDVKKQEEITKLVAIYEAMKPKEAAEIFDKLDMPILVSVAQNMKTAKFAPVLSAMDKDNAKKLTEELSQRKQFGGTTSN